MKVQIKFSGSWTNQYHNPWWLWSNFSLNQQNLTLLVLTNLVRGSLDGHIWWWYMPINKQICPLASEKSFKELICIIIGKTVPSQWGPHLLTEQVCFSNFGRGSLYGHLCLSTVKSVYCILRRRFLKVLLLVPMVFCMDLLHLSNFDRGPSKDYLCEVLSKLAWWHNAHHTTHDGQRLVK